MAKKSVLMESLPRFYNFEHSLLKPMSGNWYNRRIGRHLFPGPGLRLSSASVDISHLPLCYMLSLQRYPSNTCSFC